MSSATATASASAVPSLLLAAATPPMDNRGPAVFVVSLVMSILATIFAAMRMISKGWIVRKLTLDDWVTLVAWFLCAMLAVAVMVGAQFGLGRPDSIQPPEWTSHLLRATYIFTVLYNPCLMMTKTAILILYIRMSAAHPFLRRASIATMAVVNIAGTVLTFLSLFQCRPIYTAWTVEDGQCIDIISLYLSSAPINVITDLAILLLPLPILTSLRLEFRQKVVLVTTFVVGGFVAIVDVVRIVYLQNALKENQQTDPNAKITASSHAVDLSYHISFALMWSTVEVCTGLMCCCVLVLKPLVMRFIPAMLKDGGARANIPTPTIESYHLSVLPNDDGGSPQRLTRKPTVGGIGRDLIVGEEDDGGEVDFFQMLATGPSGQALEQPGPLPVPPSPPLPSMLRNLSIKRPQRRGRHLTNHTESGQEPTHTFFDFVNMGGKKSLTELTAREAWWPVLFTSSLFLLWGFAYGLLGTLNSEIQSLLGYSSSKTIALHNSYWLAYFFGPLILGYPILSRSGFKSTFMSGLAVFAVGAIAFWPSAVLRSYPGFFISNFLVALGLSTLETAANPFIALAGPGELSEARLNFSQGIQGIGGLISPILANRVLFRHITAKDLFRIQWCYLAVAIFVLFLAVVFFYVPLSEAEDSDLETATLYRLAKADMDRNTKTFGVATSWLLVCSGVTMMWMYVGSQETVSYFWVTLIRNIMGLHTSAFWDQAIGEGIFAFGRFLAAGLCYAGIPPRIVLATYFSGALLTAILGMALPTGHKAGMVMIILHMFFESAIFPTIYAMTLRGQGRHTKVVATALTSAISGGVIWPSVAFGINKFHSARPRLVLAMVIALYSVSLVWMSIVNSRKELKKWIDPKWSKGSTAHLGKDSTAEPSQISIVGTGSGLVGLGVSLNGGELKSQHSHQERDNEKKVYDNG